MDGRIDRRHFVKSALAGAMFLSLGFQAGRVTDMLGGRATASESIGVDELVIGEAMVEMVDLTPVYMWTFGTSAGPNYPGPMLHALEGDRVTLTVRNTLDEPHAFAVHGTSIASGPIPPGGVVDLTFDAPPPGTYIYLDPLNAPVNRLLGLCGTLVVLPSGGNAPYRDMPPSLEQLFDDLGDDDGYFPGDQWRPERTRVWHIHTVDPVWHERALKGQAINATEMATKNLPEYFLLNGQSGFFASHDHATAPSGCIGEPHLIRILNTGVTNNSLHIHGNHVYVTAVNGRPSGNVECVDTWRVAPMETADWLLPFIYPPDIPRTSSGFLRDAMAQELAYADTYGILQSPIAYPMHCHAEPSQTAAGGNYPGGLVTHWEIVGDCDKVYFPGYDPAAAEAGAVHLPS